MTDKLVSYKLSDFKRGWFIGQYHPAIMERAGEVGVHRHLAGDYTEPHFHPIAIEVNHVLSGECEVEYIEYTQLTSAPLQRQRFKKDDIFVITPGCCVKFYAVTNCDILCVKSISKPNDKVVINKEHWK